MRAAVVLSMAFQVALCAAQSQSTPREFEPSDQLSLAQQAELYTRVRLFDFDERKLGNYEDTPLHWSQLQGEGLPTLFALGKLDDNVGRTAAPSFRLDIATGNVAYEYQHLDLTVIPGSDYSLVGYIRPRGLKYAGAFMAAYFVDRFGVPIPGTHQVSNIVRGTGREPEPWQQVQLGIPGKFPLAYSLRIQFWILQDYTWNEPDPHEIDPIIRRDVYASAWFDDLAVYRLPRANLQLSNPAGLVKPDAREELVLDVNNATSYALHLLLTINDDDGRQYYNKQLEIPPLISPADLTPDGQVAHSGDARLASDEQRHITALHEPLPQLPDGFYTASLRVLTGDKTLLTRQTSFVVLPRLPAGDLRNLDLGVDLGRWSNCNVAGVQELLNGLGCGAVKVGIPMSGRIEGQEETDYFRQLSSLVRILAENRVDATGVMLAPPPSGVTELKPDLSIHNLVATNTTWQDLFSPILTQFGALLSAWQLGSEPIELEHARVWDQAGIERVRKHLRSFISIPKLAIPQPISAVPSPQEDINSVWIPAELSAATLPRLLEFLVQNNPSSYWLQLGVRAPTTPANRIKRLSDLARRLVLAKSLNPGRIFVPAPFGVSHRGGLPTWQPTEDFLVYRTLFHYLSGKTAVEVTKPAPDTIAIIFQNPDSSCMVIWTWREQPLAEPVMLYLGDQPRATDLWGRQWPLEVIDERAQIPVGPTPLIIDNMHTPLALLQASYRVAPTYVQMHTPEPRPVVTFRNTYDTQLSGEVKLTPPGSWKVKPAQKSFLLAPGESFSEPLDLLLPPHQIAETHKLDVRLTLFSPEHHELHFPESLTVGLRDIGSDASAYWDGNDLVVKQTLLNFSQNPVSFNTYCNPPGRAREERFFHNIAPGEVSIQTYVFPNSRDLAGSRIPIGISEIGGPRVLNQFAEVPQ